MIAVSTHCRGYEVKVSEPGTGTRARTVVADDLKAVKVAIDHYFGKGTGHHNAKPKRGCPLCEMVARNEASRNKKRGL
jgi:hypothetical protein